MLYNLIHPTEALHPVEQYIGDHAMDMGADQGR